LLCFFLLFFLLLLRINDVWNMSHLFCSSSRHYKFFLLFFFASFTDRSVISFLLSLYASSLPFFLLVLRLIYVLEHGSVSSPLSFSLRIYIFCYDAASVGPNKKQFVVERHIRDINMCGMNK